MDINDLLNPIESSPLKRYTHRKTSISHTLPRSNVVRHPVRIKNPISWVRSDLMGAN